MKDIFAKFLESGYCNFQFGFEIVDYYSSLVSQILTK